MKLTTSKREAEVIREMIISNASDMIQIGRRIIQACENYDAFKECLVSVGVSLAMIDLYIDIGSGRILPEVAMIEGPAGAALEKCSTLTQRRCLTKPIEVVTMNEDGTYVVEMVEVHRLKKTQVVTAFHKRKLLSKEEQIKRLRKKVDDKKPDYQIKADGIQVYRKCFIPKSEIQWQ